jgi:hypothetical protein
MSKEFLIANGEQRLVDFARKNVNDLKFMILYTFPNTSKSMNLSDCINRSKKWLKRQSPKFAGL